MKFMVIWTQRDLGGSSAERQSEAKKVLEALGRWSQPEGETIISQVVRVDGKGGFALTESDSGIALADAASKFAAWFEWDIIPVVDLMDEGTLNLFGESVAFHE